MTVYSVVSTKQYRKDVQRLLKTGMNLRKLETAIDLLTAGDLPASYRDHALRGNLRTARVCHIAPDWLLMYEKKKDTLLLLLVRTGTHQKILGIE